MMIFHLQLVETALMIRKAQTDEEKKHKCLIAA